MSSAHIPNVAERAIRDLGTLIGLVADDPAASARVALADAIVRIKLSDGPGYAFTLYLDREPVELGNDDDPAEIALAMTAGQLEELTRGELALAMEIAHGRVAYSGPIRKLLRVVPILRRVSREWLAGAEHDSHPSVPAALQAAERF